MRRSKVQIIWNNEKSDLMLEPLNKLKTHQNSKMSFLHWRMCTATKSSFSPDVRKKIEARRHWCKTKTAILFKNFYEKEFAIFHQIKIDTKPPLFFQKVIFNEISSIFHKLNQCLAEWLFGRKSVFNSNMVILKWPLSEAQLPGRVFSSSDIWKKLSQPLLLHFPIGMGTYVHHAKY